MRSRSDQAVDSYEDSFRDLIAKQRRGRFPRVLRRIDPRPASPGQVVLIGLVLVVIGWLAPVAHVALIGGLLLLVLGALTAMMRPRVRRVGWRGRQIELPASDTWATRLYRALYRGG